MEKPTEIVDFNKWDLKDSVLRTVEWKCGTGLSPLKVGDNCMVAGEN